jgi:hypothetical protein
MKCRWAVAVVGLAALAAACSGGANDVESSAPRIGDDASASRAEAAPASAGQQVVEYGGIQFEVPAGWPIHDLGAAPATCVRFDVSAVYLGTPSAAMECPAQMIGRADAVLVEAGPLPTSAARDGLEVSATTDVNGVGVQIDTSRAVEHELVVSVPGSGLTFTLSFGETDAVAQQIISTIRAVG